MTFSKVRNYRYVIEDKLAEWGIEGISYEDIGPKPEVPKPEAVGAEKRSCRWKNEVCVFAGQIPQKFINEYQVELICKVFGGLINNVDMTSEDNNTSRLGCFHAYASGDSFDKLKEAYHKKVYLGPTKVWFANNDLETEKLNKCLKLYRIIVPREYPCDTVCIEKARSFQFRMEPPEALDPENMRYIPMDLRLERQHPTRYSRSQRRRFDRRPVEHIASSRTDSVRPNVSEQDRQCQNADGPLREGLSQERSPNGSVLPRSFTGISSNGNGKLNVRNAVRVFRYEPYDPVMPFRECFRL